MILLGERYTMSMTNDKQSVRGEDDVAVVGWMELSEKDLEVIYYQGKLYRCPLCPSAFRGGKTATEHFNVVHRSFRFKCPCGKEYKSKSSFTSHQKKCAKKGEGRNAKIA